jgi:hypothetical protein
MRINYLLLLMLFVSKAQSFTCDTNQTPEDLRANLGPIRDQDSVGWCYAFTAADLVGDYLNRHRDILPENLSRNMDFTKPQNMISPLSGVFATEQGSSGAVASYSFAPDPDFKGYDDILKINQDIKLLSSEQSKLCAGECQWQCIGKDNLSADCKTWSVGRDLNKINKNSNILHDLMNKRDRFSGPYLKGIVPGGWTENIAEFYINKGFSLESQLPSTDANNAKYLSGINYEIYDAYTKALSREEAKCNVLEVIKAVCKECDLANADVMRIIEQGFDYKNSVLDLLSKMPGVAHRIKNPERAVVENTPIGLPQDGRKIINDYLGKGQIVGIGYDVKNIVSLNSGGHASSIVGRKCLKGQEHYILRNSWGENACEDGKKKMTLEYLKRMSYRVQYDPDVTAEVRRSVAASQPYKACFDKCESLLVYTSFRISEESKLMRTECRDNCYDKNKALLSENIETFECDKGYYLINSEKILKNIRNVQAITETTKFSN